MTLLILPEAVTWYLLTVFGTMAMQVFSLSKGFHGSVDFLKNVLPGRSDVFYYRIDFIVVIVTGSIVGTIFFSPANTRQALAAGFGWVGALNVLMAQHRPTDVGKKR